MYYPPPLFTPVRPFESRPNPLEGTAATAGDVPSVVGTGTRENPLDLSVKNLRQGTEGAVVEGEDLLMLEHRKLASLAASHPLSALARPGLVPGSAAALLDPTLYRLAYGPEALVPSPFCYDRATGVAVPTSLASHQLMSSILQQQQREQQQALLAARTTAAAQQAAVAAALMDPSALPFGLRGAAAMTQREVAAALAATRGLYSPAIPTPVVLPGYPLYATDEKGAFSSLRNGAADKAAYLNGAAATSSALEAARFAEHLQRLREQHIQQAAGKCANACCTGLPGLGGATAVPCACCIQSPSQSALCARSPLGSMKDPTTAATAAKVCGATTCGDYLQPGLTLLHRPAPVTTSELKLPVSSLCSTTTSTASYSTATDTTAVVSGFQPTTSWTGASLPGSSTSGKTAFSVPKKKDGTTQKDIMKPTVNHSKDTIKSEFHHHHHEMHKRDHHLDKITVTTTTPCFTYNPPVSATSIKREGITRGGDAEFMPRAETNPLLPPHPKKEHDVKSILTPKTTTPAIVKPSTYPMQPKTMAYGSHGYVGTGAQTTVTAVTPIVPTKCEGGTIIPKTSVVPPTLQSFRAHDLQFTGRTTEPQRSLPSPMGPPPLIAVGKLGPNNSVQKTTITSSVTHTTVTTTSTTAATSIYGAGIVGKSEYGRNNNSYQTTDALRHQALLHGAYHPGNFQKNVPLHTLGGADRFMAIDVGRNHKNNSKVSSVGTTNLTTPLKANSSAMPFIKEEPVTKPVPPASIPKPIPHHPTPTKHMAQTNLTASPHFAANPYLPYHLPNNNWMPPAHPNVTVAPPMQQAKNPNTTSSLHAIPPSTFTTTIATKGIKSESIPVIKKEPEYTSYTSNANNVLQSLLVRPNKTNNSTNVHQHQNTAAASSSSVSAVASTVTTTFASTAATGISSVANTTTTNNNTTVPPSAAAAAAAMLHNACSVIMPNPSTYPLLDYQYQNMIRGLNGLNLSRTATVPPILYGNTSVNAGCPAIASTAPVMPKFEPKPECSIAGSHAVPTLECGGPKAAKKRPVGGIFNPICSAATSVTGTATASTRVDSGLLLGESAEKKRCVAVETNITTPPSLHPFSLQCPPPTCNVQPSTFLPYPFVKEPQVPATSDQQLLSIKSTRPVRSVSCSTDTPPELEVARDDVAIHQQGIPVAVSTPILEKVAIPEPIATCAPTAAVTTPATFLAAIQARNFRRAAWARASSRLRKRCLAQLTYRRRHHQDRTESETHRVSQLYASWRYRKYLYGMLRTGGRAVFAGDDEPGTSAAAADRKNRRILCKVNRRRAAFPECSRKESCSALPIPAEMKKIMVNKALGETILHRAARLGYVEVVAYCLETNGSQINCQDNAGYTPLHECCSRGHLEIARALLRYGADVNASAAGGIRPLHDAVENDHVEVVRLLLSYGADPSISTYSGLTPLKLARSALMAEFLQGFIADVSGEMESRPYLPWKFWGSAVCLDPDVNGYDVFDGVPSDGEQPPEGEEDDDFVFEVSDSPHLPTFRLALGNSKAHLNYLRLSDVLRKVQITKEFFLERHGNIDIVAVPRHEFEAIATCSQLLTGSKLDSLLANNNRDCSGALVDCGPTVELVRLDNGIRKILGIETISVR